MKPLTTEQILSIFVWCYFFYQVSFHVLEIDARMAVSGDLGAVWSWLSIGVPVGYLRKKERYHCCGMQLKELHNRSHVNFGWAAIRVLSP